MSKIITWMTTQQIESFHRGNCVQAYVGKPEGTVISPSHNEVELDLETIAFIGPATVDLNGWKLATISKKSHSHIVNHIADLSSLPPHLIELLSKCKDRPDVITRLTRILDDEFSIVS